jgi:site-specific recombinase XerD
MCYKDEEQVKANMKLEEKVKNMPEFIKDYFVFLSPKSKLLYWGAIRLFFEWLINNKIINNTLEEITVNDLGKITDVHIVKYLDGLLIGQYGDRISPDTVERKKNNLSGFWSYLVEKNYVQKNIVTKSVSKKYKVEESNCEVEVPTDEQIQMLLSNIESIKSEIIALRNIAIVKLFNGSGVRISELIGLDVKDLHFNNELPTITIWAKGKKNSRDVLVSKSAIDAVNDYLKVRNANLERKELEPLFLSEHKDRKTKKNKRLAVSSVNDFFRDYSNGEIHPHMLRDYAATKMYENSLDIAGVSDQLGHGDINITKKRYVKSNRNNMLNALNSF